MLRGRPGTPQRFAGGSHWSGIPRVLSFLWAKSGRADRPPHPLLGHALDTAAVCWGLWRHGLPAAVQECLLTWAGSSDPLVLTQWLAFLAGLHDLGKATPGFQAQWGPARHELQAMGLWFPLAARPEHDRLTLELLPPLLAPLGGGFAARRLAWALAGHHLPQVTPRGPRLSLLRDGGGDSWAAVREALVSALRPPAAKTALPPGLAAGHPDLLVALGGLTQLADWVASTPAWFPPRGEVTDWTAYAKDAMSRAWQVTGLIAGQTARQCWPPDTSQPASATILGGLRRLGQSLLALSCLPRTPSTPALRAAWSRSQAMRLQSAQAARPWLWAADLSQPDFTVGESLWR